MVQVPESVDVVVIGGGAAGCIVAGRLAKADPNLEIAIIEAGINNLDHPTIIQPAMYLSHLAPTSTTAHFWAAKESKATAGRSCIVPTGGALGGGSSINFMMYTRAAASDYDDWKQEGWSFKDILPLARKMEKHHIDGHDPKIHGKTGPLEVSYGGHQATKLQEEYLEATKECYDIPYTDDLQDFKTGHGITRWAKWISPTTGRRSDTAHGYVHPVMKAQTNIHLITESRTIRVVLDENNTATAVEYCHNPLATASADPANPPKVGQVKTIKARKLVVVSAGALGTPCILERSGIGAKDHLEKVGVECKVDLPAVGNSYQDHQLTLATYRVAPDSETLDDYLRGIPEVHAKVGEQWQTKGNGLVATNAIDVGMKCRPTAEEVKKMGPAFQKVWKEYFDTPEHQDKPVMFGGLVSSFLGDHSLVPAGSFVMAGSYLMYPESRGYIHITSPDPFAAPDFHAAFLEHEADMAPQVWMYKVLREIVRRMPAYRGELAALHPKFAANSDARCRDIDVETAKELSNEKSVSAGVAPAGISAAGTTADAAEKAGSSTATGHHSADGGKKKIEDLKYTDEDDQAIELWLRENVGTTWHSMATCPMKAKEDGGVVDARLNVYGTKKLKLADLSICPANVGSNTYSAALTVGEKAAMLCAEDLGVQGV